MPECVLKGTRGGAVIAPSFECKPLRAEYTTHSLTATHRCACMQQLASNNNGAVTVSLTGCTGLERKPNRSISGHRLHQLTVTAKKRTIFGSVILLGAPFLTHESFRVPLFYKRLYFVDPLGRIQLRITPLRGLSEGLELRRSL